MDSQPRPALGRFVKIPPKNATAASMSVISQRIIQCSALKQGPRIRGRLDPTLLSQRVFSLCIVGVLCILDLSLPIPVNEGPQSPSRDSCPTLKRVRPTTRVLQIESLVLFAASLRRCSLLVWNLPPLCPKLGPFVRKWRAN